MKEENREIPRRKFGLVSLTSIVILFIAFFLGMVFMIMVNRFLATAQITLSSQAFISLVFTIALGATSLILALIAIGLSRATEEILVRRGNESVRLQNEIFLRTSEVLTRIQTSTGVTEKRLEDMISGRTGIIEQQAIEKYLPKKGTRLSEELLESMAKDITDSIRKEMTSLVSLPPSKAKERLDKLEFKQSRIETISDNWKIYRESILNRIKKCPEINLISEAAGNTNAETADRFWDMLIQIGDKRIAVDVHTKEQFLGSLFLKDLSERRNYIRRFAWRVNEDDIALAFIVVDYEIPSVESFVDMEKSLNQFYKEKRMSKVIWLYGNADHTVEEILSITRSKKPKRKAKMS